MKRVSSRSATAPLTLDAFQSDSKAAAHIQGRRRPSEMMLPEEILALAQEEDENDPMNFSDQMKVRFVM